MEKLKAINVLSALAQPTRLEAVGLLTRSGPEGLTAGEVAEGVGANASTMSAHLTILHHAGLVSASRAGRTITYRAVPGAVRQLLAFLEDGFVEPEASANGDA